MDWGAAGSWLIVGFFVFTGVVNGTPKGAKDHVERMAALGVPFPAAAFWAGIAMQLTGCALLISGWQARVGAICLIAFTALATAIFHRFWTRTDPLQRRMAQLFFLQNIALIGGLLLLLERVRAS